MNISLVISGPYFSVLKLNTGKDGPEIAPYLDTFHASNASQYYESFNGVRLRLCSHLIQLRTVWLNRVLKRISHLQVFYDKFVLKNFAEFTRKRLAILSHLESFIIKL